MVMKKDLNFNSENCNRNKSNDSDKKEQVENALTIKELEKQIKALKKEIEIKNDMILDLKNENSFIKKRNEELIKDKNTSLHKINNDDEYYAYFFPEGRCSEINIRLNEKEKIHIKNDNIVINEFLKSKRELKLIGEFNKNNIKVIHIQSKKVADEVLNAYEEKYRELDKYHELDESGTLDRNIELKAHHDLSDYYISNRSQVILTFDEIIKDKED